MSTRVTTAPLLSVDQPAPRRRFLRQLVGLIATGVGASIAAISGRAAVGQSFALALPRWVKAGQLDDLETDIPAPVTLRVTRRDGYLETVDQKVVFVTRSAKGEVHAMSSSCSHLGCSVAFDRAKNQFLCPCHNGAFSLDGAVVAGPPPKPLERLETKLDKNRILVQV